MGITDTMRQDVQHLRHIGLFRSLKEAELATIADAAWHRQVERGAFFFHEGDPAGILYVLAQGRVKLTQVTADGQEVLLRFAELGEMFGGLGMLGDTQYLVSAQAVEDCLALAWDSDTMTGLLERTPRLALNALQMLAEHVRDLQDRYRELATERVERRVARTLLRLASQTGRKMPGGILLDMRLSRQDLANMTGTTVFSVSRILSRWETQGLVKSRRERVLIRNPHALVVVAEDLPPGLAAEEPEL
jgi:CRP-like cAMP-binding protein